MAKRTVQEAWPWAPQLQPATELSRSIKCLTGLSLCFPCRLGGKLPRGTTFSPVFLKAGGGGCLLPIISLEILTLPTRTKVHHTMHSSCIHLAGTPLRQQHPNPAWQNRLWQWGWALADSHTDWDLALA